MGIFMQIAWDWLSGSLLIKITEEFGGFLEGIKSSDVIIIPISKNLFALLQSLWSRLTQDQTLNV